VSEQPPERGTPQQQPPKGKKENVFTRKIGPLPMWVWLVLIAAAILAYVMFFGKKKGKGSSSSSARGQRGPRGFGRFLVPRPPRTRHHRRGDHDESASTDQAFAEQSDRMATARSPGNDEQGANPDSDVPVGMDRRDKRGRAVPGFLVQFKSAEQGQTPSLMDVANHYNTSPEAIVQEAEGRGYPSSVAWKRYVSRHDWASPLPPATDFSILAHPG